MDEIIPALSVGEGPIIYTHESPDLDAVSSVWATRKFIQGMENARIVFVSAGWDGAELRDCDFAVDIQAGGKGHKGEIEEFIDERGSPKTIVHSCFQWIVKNFASPEDEIALEPWIRFIDLQDSRGSAIGQLVRSTNSLDARWILNVTTVSAVLASLKLVHPNDPHTVLKIMSDVFDGFLLMGQGNVRAEQEANKAELFGGGTVAVVIDKREATTDHILWRRGVLAILFIDGNNLGVLRTRHDRMPILCNDGTQFSASHPRLREVIERAGETVGDYGTDWFPHPSGFLFCHGSKKAMATYPSKVDPQELLRVLIELLGKPEKKEDIPA